MYFSLSWFQEIFNLPLSSKVLEKELTQLGLEVDSIKALTPSFEGLVVAKILEVQPHPDADRLRVATVFDGTEQLQIVCGASNCREGLLTALAPIGATLTDSDGKKHKIKQGKLRGVDSFGMLCSAEEMGLEESSEGIIEFSKGLQVGEPLAPYFQDEVLEISFTPNLGHAMSVVGVARELSCHLKESFKLKKYPLKESTSTQIQNKIKLENLAPEKCPRYACRLIENVKVEPSPFWLQQKLKSVGINSINNVVDVTNYLLHEMGHPLHAFDYDALESQQIKIQSFDHEVEFETLDGQLRKVQADSLFICDGQKPVALAGVMGGANSQVHEKTQNVLLEAAVFDPSLIRKTAKSLTLYSEASKHFERGVDPLILEKVLDRAAGLIQEIAGGEVVQGCLHQEALKYTPTQLHLRLDYLNKILGTKIKLDEAFDILQALEFKPSKISKTELKVIVPSYRNDVTLEIDLIEEVARFYGFDQIQHPNPKVCITQLPDSAQYVFENKIHQALLQEGLQEVLTCDLISPEMESLHLPQEKHLQALNSVSIDQSILRSSLLANHLQVVKHNQGHQNYNQHFYEIGKVYSKKGDCFAEETRIGITLSGLMRPYHFESKEEKCDFFHLKGILENLFDHLSFEKMTFKKSAHSSFHPGIQADIYYEDQLIGSCGELHPSHLRALNLKHSIFFAELTLVSLMNVPHLPKGFQALPTFPSSERDWTLTCLDELQVGHLIAFIKSLDSRLLKDVFLLDLYRSDKIGTHRKNVTLRFVYRNDKKTISFEATEVEHAKIISEVLEKMKTLIIQPI